MNEKMIKVIVFGGLLTIGLCASSIMLAIVYSALFLPDVNDVLVNFGGLILGFLLGNYFNLLETIVKRFPEDGPSNNQES